MLDLTPLRLRENLTYEEYPIHIVDGNDQVLQSQTIPYVKFITPRERSLESSRRRQSTNTLACLKFEVISNLEDEIFF